MANKEIINNKICPEETFKKININTMSKQPHIIAIGSILNDGKKQ